MEFFIQNETLGVLEPLILPFIWKREKKGHMFQSDVLQAEQFESLIQSYYFFKKILFFNF